MKKMYELTRIIELDGHIMEISMHKIFSDKKKVIRYLTLDGTNRSTFYSYSKLKDPVEGFQNFLNDNRSEYFMLKEVEQKLRTPRLEEEFPAETYYYGVHVCQLDPVF